MRFSIVIMAALLLGGCSLIQPIAGGNPEPNLKSIHMWENHRGYTVEDFNKHPDYDCER
jgi:hypothetical protein